MAICSSADSVLDAASLIKSNGSKLNTFVNGESDQTVQLGASTDTPTPTLRNLVANALEHVAESMGDSVETAVATINELESGKADKVSGNVEDHIAALDMYGNLQDSGINMDDVAITSVDIANLDSVKADKVSTVTSGHLAGLNASGNLTDSGIASSNVALKDTDIANLQAIKANKVSDAEAGDIAILDASGDLVDSGVKPADKTDKVADAVEGNFAGLDAEGNLTDSGRSPADITALEEAVESLEERKADKFVPAEPGNLAKLNGSGNLRDAGRAVEDFVPLLAYANGEAIELAWQNRMAIARYGDWLDEEADRHRRDMDRIADANIDAMKAMQVIRDMIDAFDESVSQRRLMNRLFDGTNPTSSSKPVLFVISGQSNAAGTGVYMPYETAEDCGQFWSWADSPGDATKTLKPIKDNVTGSSRKVGSGWCSFAKRFYALTGRKVLLFNIANGGAAVTDGGYTTENTWADNGYGILRSLRQTMWNEFSAAVPASSYDVGAILWIQGEAEAARLAAGTVTVQDYKDGTLDVLDWTRTLIGEQNCPVFIGKIGYDAAVFGNSVLADGYRKIQKAQDELCDNESIFMGFEMTPYFALPLDAGWYEYFSDGIHYSRLGYRILGNAFARSVVNYLNF